MDLEQFKEKVVILPGKRTETLRKKYIERFIDTKSSHYKEFIEKTAEFSDGLCYTGYLWDCLYNSTQISWEDILSYRDQLKEVYVFWDIHSCERILMENYWKFDKRAVMAVDFNDLLGHVDLLPEDIYIFDSSYKWTIILTHEEINGQRWCLKSGDYSVCSL